MTTLRPLAPASFPAFFETGELRQRQYRVRAALRHAADIAARQGHRRLELHVFGHNAAAQALYRSLGYEITSVNMALPLVSGRAR
jgi:GNAT superfamily N-acetyltransferase